MDRADAEDWHSVWRNDDGWWTDYPPPAGFEGEQFGAYGEEDYRRTLSPAEQEAAEAAAADDDAADLAAGEAQRAAFFAAVDPRLRPPAANDEAPEALPPGG